MNRTEQNKRNRHLQIILMMLSLILATIFDAFSDPLPKYELKVGWEDWRPYIYMENGRLHGTEYEYLKNLAAKTGCTLRFIEEPWIRSLNSLQKQSLDMLYGAGFTKERAAFAQFSKPYRYEQFVLVSRGDQTSDTIHLNEWLAEKKSDRTANIIGLIRGFHYGDTLEPIVRNVSLKNRTHEVRMDDQLRSMLISGRIDGFIAEKVVADRMAAQTPNLAISLIREARPEPMHLMFSLKVPPEIVARFNAAISEFEAIGTFQSAKSP